MRKNPSSEKLRHTKATSTHDVLVHCRCKSLHFVENEFAFCAMPSFWGEGYGQESFIPWIRNSILDLA